MPKKKAKRKGKMEQKYNPYYKSIKNIFVINGEYSTYCFFTIGKKQYLYDFNERESVYQVLDVLQKNIENAENLCIPDVFEVIERKSYYPITDSFALEATAEYREFSEEYGEQKAGFTDIQRELVQLAIERENNWQEILSKSELPKEQTYNYFGEDIAYEETDRQWIDYHMSQGNFDDAFAIHEQYVKEK